MADDNATGRQTDAEHGAGIKIKELAAHLAHVEPATGLKELVAEVVKEFGGVTAFAKKLASGFDKAPNAQKTTYFRLVARLVEAASEETKDADRLAMMSEEDLDREIMQTITKVCGPNCRLLCPMKTDD